MIPGSEAEKQLCLTLARRVLSPQLAGRAEFLLRKGLDWDTFCRLSVEHRIFPLVFRHLRRFGPPLVPEKFLRLLGALYLVNSVRSNRLAKELAMIVNAFAKADIAVVPFKGPLLGDLVWGDHRLWVGQDLDLLVRQEDLRPAIRLLCSKGYRLIAPSQEGDPQWGALRGRRKVYVELGKRDADITMYVDLHKTLFPWWLRKEALDRQLWQDVRPGRIFGTPGLLLPPSWNFILLSLHAYKHLFRLMKWVAELHELWNSDRTSRDMILRKSEEVGLKKDVSFSIAVCEHLLGEGLTESAGVNQVMVRRINRVLFGQPLSPLSEELLRLRLPESTIGMIRRLAMFLFVPTEMEKRVLRLPRVLHFLHYLVRPARLALNYGLQPWLTTRIRKRDVNTARRTVVR